MTIPYRGWTGHDVYFITASAAGKRPLLQSNRMAGLLVDVLYHYRREKKYLLHEFVVMPNHFHLLLTPEITLERALQLIKGAFGPGKSLVSTQRSGRQASMTTVCAMRGNTIEREITSIRIR